MGKASRKKQLSLDITSPSEKEHLPASGSYSKTGLKVLFLHIFFIGIIGLAAYSNSFHAPFQLDENGILFKGNPIVKNLSFFLSPSKARNLFGYNALTGRYLGYLSFAINYKLHGFDVTGYHVVNFLVHILNAVLVYFFVLLIFETPHMRGSPLIQHSRAIAVFSALLFVSHPVQTEAVTYVFQRLASLMTTFYLLSIMMYIKGRLLYERFKKANHFATLALYLFSLLFAIMAMKTKENAFTLPLVIALFEFVFLRRASILKSFLFLLPLLMTLSIVPLSVVNLAAPGLPGDGVTNRWDYLFTQLRVIVTYIRLLFFPINQNIHYDYPVYKSFFAPQVLLSFIFLACLFGFGVYLVKGKRHKIAAQNLSSSMEPERRLIGFGILWFFITLSVESSIIPIPEIICEYRVYLPSIGFFIAAVTAVFGIACRPAANQNAMKKATITVLSFFVVILVVLTYSRNSLWADPFALWADTVTKSPGKGRPYNNLGNAYVEHGRWGDAENTLLKGISMAPDFLASYVSLSNLYIRTNKPKIAAEMLEKALTKNPRYAQAYIYLVQAYMNLGQPDRALAACMEARKFKVASAELYGQMSSLYREMGKTAESIEAAKLAIEGRPDYAPSYFNLGLALADVKRYDEAEIAFKEAVGIAPEFAAQAYNNLGEIYRMRGRYTEAKDYYKMALNADPKFQNAHINLGIIYLLTGERGEAIKELAVLQTISPEGAAKLTAILNSNN